MNITAFCDSHNVKIAAVTNTISRHQELFKSHTKRIGKSVELDDDAIKILEDKWYPIPKPIEIINGIDQNEYERVRNKLEAASDTIIKLQQQLQEQTLKLSAGETAQLMLEEKNNQLSDLKNQNEELKKALEVEKNKSWWAKLRCK